MIIFDIALVLSTFMCSLVAGLLFSYAIVVMPGFKILDDKSFIKAFQVTDRIIQKNHPLFLLVWLGSAVSIIIFVVSGFEKLEGVDFFMMLLASIAYIIGVQVPTIIINLPLNNKLQEVDVDNLSEEELKIARSEFEHRWNRSNEIRTVIACSVSLVLIILMLKL
jgi:uncharacterized membrane protein